MPEAASVEGRVFPSVDPPQHTDIPVVVVPLQSIPPSQAQDAQAPQFKPPKRKKNLVKTREPAAESVPGTQPEPAAPSNQPPNANQPEPVPAPNQPPPANQPDCETVPPPNQVGPVGPLPDRASLLKEKKLRLARESIDLILSFPSMRDCQPKAAMHVAGFWDAFKQLILCFILKALKS